MPKEATDEVRIETAMCFWDLKEAIDEVRIETAMRFWDLTREQALETLHKLDAKLDEASEKEQRSIVQLRKEISDEVMHCNNVNILRSTLRILRG